MDPYLSVIIPAFNEEKRIGKTLGIIWDYLKKQPYTWEILVVVDGARDDTAGAAAKFAGEIGTLRVIGRKKNRGKGFSVREGMLEAKGKIRLFTDADNSTDISHFDKMKPFFDAGWHVVICSRDKKDAPGAHQAVSQAPLKRLMGNMGNLFIQIFAVPGIWDTQCGFKAFTAEAARRIFQIARIDRWGFDIEALALARRFRFKIAIVPAYWINDAESHVTLGGYIGVLFETLKIRWGLLTGKYT